MADISKITVNSTSYDLKDKVARAKYGTCSSSASATTKEVACSNFILETGAVIAVKFANTNTGAVASLKLDVNSTGAKAIKYKGENLSSADIISANSVLQFAYDGTNYEIVGGIGSGGNYVPTSRTVNNKALSTDITLDASDVGAVASDQGSGNAGKFMVVGNDGIVAPVEMTAWAGGSY